MKIKKNNILTVDKYIYEALYNRSSGYYMKGILLEKVVII